MSKTKNTKTTAPVVVEPVVVKVEAAPVVVAEKKVAKKAASKKVVETPVVVAPVVVEEVVAAPVETVVAPSTESSLVEQSTDFFAKLQQLGAMISSLKSEYRALEKKWTKELKNSAKHSNKKRKRAANRAPSGFVKPTQISDELAQFLDKPTGSEMARTEVTRDINAYIRTNNLQDKTNGRKINPDARLAGLLQISSGEELTYFNLQKYMSRHFSKNVKASTTSA